MSSLGGSSSSSSALTSGSLSSIPDSFVHLSGSPLSRSTERTSSSRARTIQSQEEEPHQRSSANRGVHREQHSIGNESTFGDGGASLGGSLRHAPGIQDFNVDAHLRGHNDQGRATRDHGQQYTSFSPTSERKRLDDDGDTTAESIMDLSGVTPIRARNTNHSAAVDGHHPQTLASPPAIRVQEDSYVISPISTANVTSTNAHISSGGLLLSVTRNLWGGSGDASFRTAGSPLPLAPRKQAQSSSGNSHQLYRDGGSSSARVDLQQSSGRRSASGEGIVNPFTTHRRDHMPDSVSFASDCFDAAYESMKTADIGYSPQAAPSPQVRYRSSSSSSPPLTHQENRPLGTPHHASSQAHLRVSDASPYAAILSSPQVKKRGGATPHREQLDHHSPFQSSQRFNDADGGHSLIIGATPTAALPPQRYANDQSTPHRGERERTPLPSSSAARQSESPASTPWQQVAKNPHNKNPPPPQDADEFSTVASLSVSDFWREPTAATSATGTTGSSANSHPHSGIANHGGDMGHSRKENNVSKHHSVGRPQQRAVSTRSDKPGRVQYDLHGAPLEQIDDAREERARQQQHQTPSSPSALGVAPHGQYMDAVTHSDDVRIIARAVAQHLLAAGVVSMGAIETHIQHSRHDRHRKDRGSYHQVGERKGYHSSRAVGTSTEDLPPAGGCSAELPERESPFIHVGSIAKESVCRANATATGADSSMSPNTAVPSSHGGAAQTINSHNQTSLLHTTSSLSGSPSAIREASPLLRAASNEQFLPPKTTRLASEDGKVLDTYLERPQPTTIANHAYDGKGGVNRMEGGGGFVHEGIHARPATAICHSLGNSHHHPPTSSHAQRGAAEDGGGYMYPTPIAAFAYYRPTSTGGECQLRPHYEAYVRRGQCGSDSGYCLEGRYSDRQISATFGYEYDSPYHYKYDAAGYALEGRVEDWKHSRMGQAMPSTAAELVCFESSPLSIIAFPELNAVW